MSDTSEPVAWAIQWASDRDIDCEFVFPEAVTAGDVQLENSGSVVVPLYRHPQPTLTDAERLAIAVAMHRCDGPEFKTLRGLLERMK